MEHVSRKNMTRARTSWSSIAFIVESILLLVFLAASLAVLTKVFSASLNASVESRTLDAATIAAGSIAEHFAAEPTGVDEQTELGDLIIKCDVTDEQRADGTLHHATITVYDKTGAHGSDPVYELTTARYESGGSTGAAPAPASTASTETEAATAADTQAESEAEAPESGVEQ